MSQAVHFCMSQIENPIKFEKQTGATLVPGKRKKRPGRQQGGKKKKEKKRTAGTAFSCISTASNSRSAPALTLEDLPEKAQHLQIFTRANVSASSAWGGLQVVCYTGVGLHRKWHMQPDWDGPERPRHKRRAQMGPRASGSSTLMNTQLSTTLHNMQNNILRPR